MVPETHPRKLPSNGPGRTEWIVSPIFDTLFVANLLWPLAFLPGYVSAEGTPYVAFWMAYFIATPHRWMTIFVAAADPDRRHGRSWLFVLLAVATAGLIAGCWWATGGLRALGLFYALIVGWHFAAQHAGILRMYSRKAGGGRRWLETWPPRVFIFYASLRLMPGFDQLTGCLRLNLGTIDWAVLGIPAVLLAFEVVDGRLRRLPKVIYLASVCSLYSSLILAAHYRQHVLALALLAAATIFHSVEYMAVVTHYARRRRARGSPGVFQKVARRWTVLFPWYVISCGLLYTFGDKLFVTAWFAVNLWASILHCAYDGLMWKLRDPATASVLGVEATAKGSGVFFGRRILHVASGLAEKDSRPPPQNP